MKNKSAFGISSVIGLVIGYAAIVRLLLVKGMSALDGTVLPAGFPSQTGFIVIWGFLFLLWALGSRFVYSVKLSPRRERNIFLNSLILVIGIFIWNYLIFGSLNIMGALAVSAALLLLGVIVWFMYLVTHRYGGYLFIPMMIWLCYILYLSIAMAVRN